MLGGGGGLSGSTAFVVVEWGGGSKVCGSNYGSLSVEKFGSGMYELESDYAIMVTKLLSGG